MASDPYGVLGVAKAASEDEIRSAFRRLAKSCHPDLHPGDTAASERFKRLSSAYELLSDAEKRRQFDAGLIDASGEPVRGYSTHRAGAAPGAGFGDVFSDLFGDGGWGGGRPGYGGGPRAGLRGQDVRYTLDIDFLESITGAKKRVTMPDGGVLDLTVPEGVSDGQVLRMRGKGRPAFGGGEAGDALVEIRVRPHPDYKRSGDDLSMSVPITIDEAVLGGKIEVAAPGGRLQLALPKGTSSGQVFRLRGKGVRAGSSGRQGDLLVTVKIVMPDVIDEGLSYFMSEWRQKHRYDPRG
ncbi:MAG: DnaJ domain-containing protein [Hyphomicrobiaceae bacterium]|nr:DnaJ domain-containing protein [Hyphomicrobiaceae bacterium]